MALLEVFLASLAAAVALVLAAVTFLSYFRSRHPRLLLVAAALVVFGGKAAWIAAALYDAAVEGPPRALELGLDLGTVLLLYAALMQRTRG